MKILGVLPALVSGLNYNGGDPSARHTQSLLPFPLVRPFFNRSSLRGWWGGMVRWEGQPKHRAAAPATTPLLSRTPCDQHSRLSQTRRASGGETRHGGRRRTTDQDNETNTAAGAAARQRAAQQQRQSETGQDTPKGKQGRKGEKAKTPAQQTTEQHRTAAPLKCEPRPTPPSACVTHDARKGIGRSPNGTPAIS